MYFGIPAIVSAGDKDRELILDRVSDPFFAFSMQKLSSSFNGTCIRGADTNTLLEDEFKPYTYSDPSDLDRFKQEIIDFSPGSLFRVLELKDQSGSGFNPVISNVSNGFKLKGENEVFWLTQSNSDEQTTPDNDLINIEKPFPGIQDQYYVTRADCIDPALPDIKNECTLFFLNGNRGTGIRCFFGLNGVRIYSGYKEIGVTVADGTSVFIQEVITRQIWNGLTVICFRLFSDGTYDLTENGRYIPTSGTLELNPAYTANRMRFGREMNALPSAFNKEMIFYDTALSDEQVRIVINDMRARYGCL
ncbi:MAG: hypothetical protein LPK80_04620 [Bacteroidota bacterium]|nr:hypothetical protein [Bacteroidota bacterium]